MYLASVDIKTVFDVPRPTPTANNMGDQEVHGWITAASEREMAGLEGQATFEDVHGSRQFARCIRQQSAEAPWPSLKNDNADLVRKKMGLHLETCQAGDHQICSFAWADNF